MYSINDIFTPSFFMILGVVLLLMALLVVYFESKYREQNHKIASMLSLVSSLGSEIYNIKYTGQLGGNPTEKTYTNLENVSHLIPVSDDEDDDADTDDDDDADENVLENDSDFENDVPSISLKVLNFGSINTMYDLSPDEFIQSELVDQTDTIELVEKDTQIKNVNVSGLEELPENIETEYKKYTIQKLKSIVLEKGLSSDPSKLKKNELLKILEPTQ